VLPGDGVTCDYCDDGVPVVCRDCGPHPIDPKHFAHDFIPVHRIPGEVEYECCGQQLASGECCASVYGDARLVQIQGEDQVVPCAKS
jgi:hypothetical protein